MKTELGLHLDSKRDRLPSYVRCDQVWAGMIHSGKYNIPVRFFTDTTNTLDDLLAFASPVISDFEKKFDAKIYDEVLDLSGWHNKFTSGQHRFEDADAMIPHLTPDEVHFWAKDLFCIEFSPYRPLAHLGFSLRLFPSDDWGLRSTSWDRDMPRFRIKKQGSNKSATAQRP